MKLRLLVAAGIALVAFSFAHAGDLDLGYVDKSGPAYATYKRYVDSCLTRSDCYMFTAVDAAYLAKLDGGAQYCPKAVALADAYVSKVEASIESGGQPNWGADANGIDGISSDSYLHVGPNLEAIALPMKWCQPTSTQVTRWTAVLTQAVYNVWNPSQAKWGGRSFAWSGWATNDPANNYFYSFTLATQMYQWVTGDAQYASKTWPLISSYMATIPTGGSEEGTGYGTSHKELFGTMRNQRDLFGENYADAHLTNSILYWLHAATPDFQHFAAIGDQSRVSEPTWWDYQDALIMQACSMTADAGVKAQGAWLLARTPAISNSINYRDALLPKCGPTQQAPMALVYNGASTGDFLWRTGWDATALWGTFRAGKLDQSHAHQDQGSFSLYQNGAWLAVDASIWSHSGIEQGVTNNNTLRFVKNGAVVSQAMNSASSMTVSGTDPATGVHAVANLKPAVSSAVSAWTRKFDLVGSTLTITDAYAANAGYAGIWQASLPVQPVITGKTAVAGNLTITVLAPADAVLTATDWRTVSVPGYGLDYGKGWRLDIASATNTGYTVALSTGGVAPPPPPANVPPVAAFTSTSDGLTATFANTSTDSDGRITLAAWDFGDGSMSTAMNPTHAYKRAGTYTAKLTVTDDDQATSAVSHPVTVAAAPTPILVKVSQGARSHTFVGAPACGIVASSSAGAVGVAQHWHCTNGIGEGDGTFDFPSAAPLTYTKQ